MKVGVLPEPVFCINIVLITANYLITTKFWIDRHVFCSFLSTQMEVEIPDQCIHTYEEIKKKMYIPIISDSYSADVSMMPLLCNYLVFHVKLSEGTNFITRMPDALLLA